MKHAIKTKINEMENLRKRLNSKTGFTLVELLVVIAIIAILSVTAFVALGGQTGKARDARRLSDTAAIQNALELYFINNNSQYPDDLATLELKEMPTVPVDPWSELQDYAYEVLTPGKRSYQLAATLEGEEGILEAHVVGNSDTDLIDDGVQTSDCTTPCTVSDGSTTCVPYCQP